MADVDARAKEILFDTYWTPKGWRDRGDRPVSAADRAYAVQRGMMFEPLSITHDALLAALRDLARDVDPVAAAGQFLASLTTRRLDLRSALASASLARDLPRHSHASRGACPTCGAPGAYADEDLDVLNFERHKWGGVRHGDVMYMHLDLREFARAARLEVTEADREAMRAVLRVVATSAPKDTPGALSKRLAGLFPSAKSERDQAVEILAAARVLVPSNPARASGEFEHAGAWRGADGYDAAVVARLFGPHGL